MQFVSTETAPKAVGPYSQGTIEKNVIFTSGQLPIDPETGVLVQGDIQKATLQSLKNVLSVVEAGGGSLEDIAKITVFVTNMKNFPAINAVYSDFFGDHKPARSLVQVAELPLGGEIEIEATCII
ncbi:MAG: Rid family detoxifying hydrolase [Desulfovibrio sp.]|uniref:Rid family detoxifying hydrolase n=1 Tax=Desulfovibrio sp. 7SRBS1 TaxID=3378064 RepID=UPI003B3CAA37